MRWISSQLDQDLDRALELDVYRAFVRNKTLPRLEMMMAAEIVTFEGHRPHFELTPCLGRLGWTVVQTIRRGELTAAIALPGTPAELAAMLRARARYPGDVFGIINKLSLAALKAAA